MGWFGAGCWATSLSGGLLSVACSGTSLPASGASGSAGSDASSGGTGAGGSTSSGGSTIAQALGSLCIGASEFDPNFSGYDAKEVGVETESNACSSTICLKNHFQGLVNCPYGQAAGAGACLIPGSNVPVAVEVEPQLLSRQASVASICSCHCAGSGAGPFCDCPDGMDCVDLVPDLAGSALSGSYCIPSASEFNLAQLSSTCTPPNCGPAQPD